MIDIKPAADAPYNDPAALKKTEAAAPPLPLIPNSELRTPHSPPSSIDREMLIEILLNAGFKSTEENLAMLKLLMDNGIPLTKENILRMNQALKLTAVTESTVDGPNPATAAHHGKALFMILNNIKLTTANAAQLEGFVSGKLKITGQIDNLLQAVRQINDPALASQITRILASVSAAETAQPQPTTGTFQTTNHTQAAPRQPVQQPIQQPSVPAQSTVFIQTTPQQQSTPLQSSLQQSALPGQPPTQSTVAPQHPPMPVQSAASPPTQNSAQAPTNTTEQNATQQNPTQTSVQPTPPQPTASQPLPPPFQPPNPLIPSPVLQPPNSESPSPNPSIPNSGFQTPNAESPPPLTFRLTESTPADIDRFLNNLRDALTQIRQAITLSSELRTPNPEISRVLQEVRTFSNTIDFTAQIRNQLYVQLPLYYNGQEHQLALHVYKDTKKTADGKKDTASALISLDTASLGRFETYIQKSDASVHCQFRLDTPGIEGLVRDHINELETLLRNHNLSLGGFSFAKPGKPYTLLDSPSLFDDEARITEPLGARPRFDKKA
ncbi:MAG: DUF6240 domain-containing protein [Defluviitaleaceae bacterium]|nr:DUF6240 domain-containing protein [Defluviitaleaceae bacterium]